MIYLRVLWNLLLILPEMIRAISEIRKQLHEREVQKNLEAIERAKNAKTKEEAQKALDDLASGLK